MVNQFKGYRSTLQKETLDWLVSATNVFINQGILRKRKKFEGYPAITGWAERVNGGFFNWRGSGADQLLIKDDTNNRFVGINGTTRTVLTPILFSHADGEMDCVEIDGKVYMAYGATNIARIDPLNYLVRQGLQQASYAMNLNPQGVGSGFATAIGGNIKQDYAISWYQEYGTAVAIEGNVSIVVDGQTTIFPGTADKITVTRPAAPDDCTHWYLYRRPYGVGLYYRIAGPIVKATTTYDDFGTVTPNIQLPGPNDHTRLTDPVSRVAWFANRMWASQTTGNKVYFSNLNQPDYTPVNQYFELGDRFEEGIIRLIPYDSFLLVVKSHSMWIIEGDSLISFRAKKIADFGSLSWKATIRYGNEVIFANKSGIYRWDFISTPVNIGEFIWEDFTGFTLANLCAIVEPTFNHIWFYSTGGTSIFVFNPTVNNFVGEFVVGNTINFATVFKSPTNSYVLLSLNTTTQDTLQGYNSGSAISIETTMNIDWKHGELVEPLASKKKFYRLVKLMYHGATSSEVITLALEVGGVDKSIGTFDIINTAEFAQRNIGVSADSGKLHFSKTGATIANDWELIGLDIELMPTTLW
jgi:hypothetical protein